MYFLISTMQNPYQKRSIFMKRLLLTSTGFNNPNIEEKCTEILRGVKSNSQSTIITVGFLKRTCWTIAWRTKC